MSGLLCEVRVSGWLVQCIPFRPKMSHPERLWMLCAFVYLFSFVLNCLFVFVCLVYLIIACKWCPWNGLSDLKMSWLFEFIGLCLGHCNVL